jgi:hypothetical protein
MLSGGGRPMSALGHKRTNSPGQKFGFVRYCPKADKRWCGWIVRSVPMGIVSGIRVNKKPSGVKPEGLPEWRSPDGQHKT